jgi:hypothetical protein
VRRLLALHSGLSVERDAWATAALVQAQLGFAPDSPVDELAGLDDDVGWLHGTLRGPRLLGPAAPAIA